MRYLIDVSHAEPETDLTRFRTTLAWAATRSDRFIARIQPTVYDDPGHLHRLRRLGRVTTPVSPDPPRDLVGRLLQKLFRIPENIVQVEGKTGQRFVRQMTRTAVPPQATTKESCPVEDLMLFDQGRLLYAAYDYGRDQVLDLTDSEFESLCLAWEKASLDPVLLVPAPIEAISDPAERSPEFANGLA